ncbi:porin [Shewanella intestini]|uniref:Porin n=1 Tax=Shewanella intestini TaxID=2017544 RepID=A0ABS5I8E4_9GAMM|nr:MULTISPECIES: porin [Shewanella]MBR9729560.1 porin [Shewanella intestini]MRG35444.1 porin [Shewanella sp. XMDDZSB0408]
MNKTLLASALAVVMFAPTASAIEIYKDAKNAVSIGGYVDARVYHGLGDTEVANGASRINFAFDRQMGNGWEANVKFEWSVNPFGNNSLDYTNDGQLHANAGDFLANRLGYVEVKHDTYGQLAIGKIWGAWYDVVNATNLVNTWDGDSSGTYTFNKGDGSVNGTGRGDKTVQYRNAFGDVSFAVQVQLKQDDIDIVEIDTNKVSPAMAVSSLKSLEYKNTYGMSVTYDATDKIAISAGYNTGEFDAVTDNGSTFKERDSIVGVGIKYGEWAGDGFYFAANYNQNEYHDTDGASRIIPEAKGLESLLSYRFDNNIRLLTAYNVLEAGDEYEALYNGDKFKRQFFVLGLHYIWDENTVLYVEGRFDNSDFTGSQEEVNKLSDHDGVGVGVRYFL